MDAQAIAYTSKISNGYTDPPEIIRKARGLYSRPPCNRREVFSCAGYCHGGRRAAHSPRAGASYAEKDKKKVRTGSPDRVFVMKNRAFVEFISKIRSACLFLHIVNKRPAPMLTKTRTFHPMQTPRDIAYTGTPADGRAATYSPARSSAPAATDNPETSFTE